MNRDYRWFISSEMATLDFRAHGLDYEVSEFETLENGDRRESSKYWVEDYTKCDIVPAGQASTFTFDDGQKEKYSYTVYLSRDCREFKYGERVRINMYGKKRVFKVVGFQRYQLQAKLWVSE